MGDGGRTSGEPDRPGAVPQAPSDAALAARAKLRRAVAGLVVREYLTRGGAPWSPGYLLYREEYIGRALADPDVARRFRHLEPLPEGYGAGLDERCVEYPWLFARLGTEAERLLDAGSAVNHAFLLDHPIWHGKRLHILTLAPEHQCHWDRGISYLFEDLRDIPVRDDYYDAVICVSTLEHVGFDNRRFAGTGVAAERGGAEFTQAVRELRRVLRPGGRLLLTVPFGRYRDLGTQQVFDEALLDRALAALGPGDVTRAFFAYTSRGWQWADAAECAACEYVDWIMLPEERRPAEFPVQPDGATAARAVACVEFRKPAGTAG